METPSEENQVQRQDKRGTNECSQRASSVLYTAVFTGSLACLVSLYIVVAQHGYIYIFF